MTICRAVLYEPSMHDELVAFHARSFASDPATSARYLRWKYAQSPYAHEPLLYVAIAGGKVVGMRGAYATVWDAPSADDPLVLPCFGDTAVDPAYTSRGVFRSVMDLALADLRCRGFPYALNIGASPVTLLNSLATGWRAVGSPVALRRLSPSRRARDRAGRVPGLRRAYRRLRAVRSAEGGPADRADPFARFDASLGAHPGSITLERDPLPEAMAELAGETAGPARLHPASDAGYFAWRFADTWTEHRFAFVQPERDLDAYVVFRGAAGHERVTVVDWRTRSLPLLRRLLTAAGTAGRWPEVVVWAGGAAPDGLEAFRQAGFESMAMAHAVAVLVRSTSVRDSNPPWRIGELDLLDEESWELRLLPAERMLVDSGVKSRRPAR